MSHQTEGTRKSLATLLEAVKQMGGKSAESNAETVGTSHPIGDTPDGTQAASEGARSSENAADVKELAGSESVENDSKPDSSVGSPTDIGPITPKTTGEDPSNETSSTKGTKEDPGTSHPASADTGAKYSSATEEFEALCKQANALGAQVMQYLLDDDSTEAPKAADTKAAAAQVAASQPGVNLGAVTGNTDLPAEDKRACDEFVLSVTRQACADGIKCAEALLEYYAGLKQANDEAAAGAGMEPGGEEAPPSGDDGGHGDAGSDLKPEEIAQLIAALEGGAGGHEGGDEQHGDEAQDLAALLPLLQGQGGGDAGGGMPPAPVDAMGGGAGDAAALQQVLGEMGVSPEEAGQKAAAYLLAKAGQNKASAAHQQKVAKMRKQVQELLGRR